MKSDVFKENHEKKSNEYWIHILVDSYVHNYTRYHVDRNLDETRKAHLIKCPKLICNVYR